MQNIIDRAWSPLAKTQTLQAGCAFSGGPLAHGNWKFWWAIGMNFNGRPQGDWK